MLMGNTTFSKKRVIKKQNTNYQRLTVSFASIKPVQLIDELNHTKDYLEDNTRIIVVTSGKRKNHCYSKYWDVCRTIRI